MFIEDPYKTNTCRVLGISFFMLPLLATIPTTTDTLLTPGFLMDVEKCYLNKEEICVGVGISQNQVRNCSQVE